MRGPATRLEHNNGRPPLRLNAVDWAICAIVAACVLGAWAFTCSSIALTGFSLGSASV
jgi:1,4-dihydroxy-2-naphthoate octaprenyltransferase